MSASLIDSTYSTLQSVPALAARRNVALSSCTRFGVGGPTDIFVETASLEAFILAVKYSRDSGLPYYLIGEGSNLIASDDGFRGIILRLTKKTLEASGATVRTDAGVTLQDLVNFTCENGLRGLETLAGIPGSVGAAIYGNAGAYGHTIADCIKRVRVLDGLEIRQYDQAQCGFCYRESVFKQYKEHFILDAELVMEPGDPTELRRRAEEIVAVRNKKFPPAMKCAGSIFKNLLVAEIPAAVSSAVPQQVIREGKIPAAYFLEQVGAKGKHRGRVRVAGYHANLLYNEGGGTADDLRRLIQELSRLVEGRFGIVLEEEVQYLGFEKND